MKICVLGAGSLGSVVGGRLAAGGNEVFLVNRNRDFCDAINESGLILQSEAGNSVVRPLATTDVSSLGVVDLAIVLVKSYDTRDALKAARNLFGPDTVVMSLQNGLGHEDIIAEVVGRDRVIAGKTYVGGQVLAPGRVSSTTAGRETIIGELDGTISARVKSIADTFEKAGLKTDISSNVLGVIWDKLLVNVATGALSGVTRLPYGKLYAVPEIEACGVAAVLEAMTVARAKGIVLATVNPKDAWLKAGAGLPAEFKASILQSLDKGRRTEIDFINGAVVRAGLETGVPTPVNTTLVACIKGIERGLDAMTKDGVLDAEEAAR